LTDYNMAGWGEAIESFDGMGLPDELLRGIYACGFEKLSAIQQRAIKPTMSGKDLIAQAQIWNGKKSTTQSMPLDVLEVAERFMREPVRILVKREELTLEDIKQFYIAVDREEWKLECLCHLYETLTIIQAIIYCNTRRKVVWF
jgi:superfamily II DNA/RNA helicase